jgi:multidrug efflux pump subunit AcrA (membrane-fusion protein)
MPTILPSAPITAGQDFGSAIAGWARDYEQESLQQKAADQRRAQQLADEATARTNQLSDTASARAYQQELLTEEQQNRIKEQHDSFDYQNYKSGVQALINEGYLSPTDATVTDKVSAAFAAAQKDGLTDRYKALLTTPDENGAPLPMSATQPRSMPPNRNSPIFRRTLPSPVQPTTRTPRTTPTVSRLKFTPSNRNTSSFQMRRACPRMM